MKVKIAPSLMCMDLLNVQEQMKVLNRADYLHVDILDWHYARNLCLSPSFMGQLKAITSVPMDAHLMVDNTDLDIVDSCINAGAGVVTLPPDIVHRCAFRLIDRIRSAGVKAGAFINPGMPLEIVFPYIHLLDMITFMTVDPGYAGQPFVEESLAKMAEAKQLKQEKGYAFTIQVDGSCNKNTFKRLYDAGAEVFVIGSSSGLFNSGTRLEDAWEIMEREINGQLGK